MKIQIKNIEAQTHEVKAVDYVNPQGRKFYNPVVIYVVINELGVHGIWNKSGTFRFKSAAYLKLLGMIRRYLRDNELILNEIIDTRKIKEAN